MTDATRTQADNPSADAREAAQEAGLIYVSDSEPGIRRRRAGSSFAYYTARGERVSEAKTLQRIRSLAVPPAYTDVWICTKSNGHLQATGRDARNRKQYRYHPRWTESRGDTKYEQL